ncbi:MAG: histidinol phosphatase [Nitriliruptorales bacterium]|nr:histidinol phosphatase [Nitriliruptorales bacterium]
MTPDVERYRSIALRLADVADEVSLRHFGGDIDVQRKQDGSFVTAADKAVERAIREGLSELAPGDAVLGEEQGGVLDADVPTWVIDPIDATNNFLRGIPVYATLISVVVGTTPVVGVASAPAMGERWDAAQGKGARRNGLDVAVSDVDDLRWAQLLHGGLNWWRSGGSEWETLGRLSDAVWRTRGFGDFWMHLLVAGGMAEVAVDRDLKPWDIAAVECIVTEAGGRMTAYDGGPPIPKGEALSSNGRLHDAALRVVRGAAA